MIPSVGFISLGCPKATVDSERLLTRLRADGYQMAPSYEAANLVVINTCGFIEDAVSESLETIGEAMAACGRVIVTGCLGAREAVIRDAYPDLLAITGPEQDDAVMAAVHQHLPPPDHPFDRLIPPQGVKLTPAHTAYIKIAEGCDHRCSFCVIPSLRGPLRSRPIGEVLEEAQRLVDHGVRELLVISQDTSAYGRDLNHKLDFWRGRPLRTDLTSLAQVFGEIAPWVRLHYVYPYPSVDQLIPLMAQELILPYLDMPLQHASLAVLRAMRRPAATERMLERLTQWREQCPTLAIRSTFIVGFPGETEEDFAQLLAFMSEAQLDRVGCFAYSPVTGAAANALPDAVADEVKQERLERFMAHQAVISRAKLRGRVDQDMIVMIDRIEPNRCIARSHADAPEIDGEVIIPGAWEVEPGDFIMVRITDSTEHDLIGEPTDYRP
ncbi:MULTISPECIES: 30S ribosomal protein S12 methylthiotransferase RimO [Thiorhodovibrio]|uniref:30S ribosomal protein S12 methylthiotransferase RimO n=1 Tax=Thiorhodovibrio TaxID=61593 RepID=UPI001914BDC5|nr:MULTISPECIES: 30S ribosomal protein S12 methylthiotransferase RimO [Thiorhodovibrio]MBK5968463.1 30S ribosomal protein S12 methylthiotransferase RimO [Thiorhodovibrio winogradskyi]WPL11106.1 Ribosomal protein S12 methylthiotransferase RimO [Thiorhodovibrio litoralis]